MFLGQMWVQDINHHPMASVLWLTYLFQIHQVLENFWKRQPELYGKHIWFLSLFVSEAPTKVLCYAYKIIYIKIKTRCHLPNTRPLQQQSPLPHKIFPHTYWRAPYTHNIGEVWSSPHSHKMSSMGKPYFLKLSFDLPWYAICLEIFVQTKVVLGQVAGLCLCPSSQLQLTFHNSRSEGSYSLTSVLTIFLTIWWMCF